VQGLSDDCVATSFKRRGNGEDNIGEGWIHGTTLARSNFG
jgi:hypothetical protein